MRLWNCLAVVAETFNVKLDRLTNELFGLIATLADCDTPRQIRYVRSHATSCFFEDDRVFHALLFFLQSSLFQDTSKCTKWLPKLAMTSATANQLPAIVLKHSDDFAHLHGAEPSTRLEQPKVIDRIGSL